jgi:hypothetical protein
MYKKTKMYKLALGITTLITSLTLLIPQQIIHAAEDEENDMNTTATVTFDAGELTLPEVPAFDFGTQAIADNVQTYSAANASNSIQISDLRGSTEGWTLNVSLSVFTQDEQETLQDSYITIKDAKIEALNGTKGTLTNVADELKIDSDSSETNVFSTGQESGGGLWQISWTADKATLTVFPGTVLTGTSTAELTWTLVTGP